MGLSWQGVSVAPSGEKSVSLFPFVAGDHPAGECCTSGIRFASQAEDILFGRGTDICHERLRFWWNRFGPMFAAEILKSRVQPRWYSNWRWPMDDVFVRINGEMFYLWRAVDHERRGS